MPENEWKFHVEDILERMGRAANYTQAMSFADFERSDMTFDAVERNLIAIGEAANRLPEGVREAHSEIPWEEIIETGNTAIHRYFERQPRSTWNAIHEDFPRLAPKMRHILESEG